MVRIEIISAKFDMFDLFLPFVDKYFSIQHSFSIKFCTKNGNIRSLVTRNSMHGTNYGKLHTGSSVKTGIQALLKKTRGMPGG